MSKSKKGILTEMQIIKSAKTLFHEKGYIKTSMRDISAHSNVKLGTLTYYFNKKQDLAIRIYSDLIVRLYSFIKSNRTKKMKSLQLNFHVTRLYQHFYSLDRRTSDFHSEIISNDEIYEFIYFQIFMKLYQTFYIEISKKMSKNDLETAIISDLAVKRELSKRFLAKEYPKDSRELFTDSSIMMGRLFRVPEETTRLYISDAIEFFDTYDSSSIKLLV